MDTITIVMEKGTQRKRLTQGLLGELIDRMEVYHVEKMEGEKIQRLKIHYHCLVNLESPDILPEPDISIAKEKE